MTGEDVTGPQDNPLLSETETVAALADAIFPAGDGLGSATQLGAVDYVMARFAGAWGRGEDLYWSPPFEHTTHPGHGHQSPVTPAELAARALRVLRHAAEFRFGRPFSAVLPSQRAELVADLACGDLDGYHGVTAFTTLREVILEGVFGDPRHGGNRDGAAWAWLGYHPAGRDTFAEPGAP